MEHGEPISPLSGGRARLLNGRCDASLVKRPVRGIHTVVAVEVPPHEPSDGLILLGRAGSKLSVEGPCNRFRTGLGFSIEGD